MCNETINMLTAEQVTRAYNVANDGVRALLLPILIRSASTEFFSDEEVELVELTLLSEKDSNSNGDVH